MWKRFANILRCPECHASLALASFRESTEVISREHLELARQLGVMDSDFSLCIDFGVLLCRTCRTRFPIMNGLPVMLCYATPLRQEFAGQFRRQLLEIGSDYEWPELPPVEGEMTVMRSFSQEWREYQYDGVLWHNNYEDLENAFLQEVGFEAGRDRHARFVEIGCGIGVTTSLAQKHYRGDAVGVDLSLACMQAAQHYRSNPFMHFVQASAFRLPLEESSFDVVYSRGVLHHTYSTRDAFLAVARLCRPGGLQYLWVYGPKSNTDSLARRGWYALELVLRPILCRWPSALPTRVLLGLLTVPYRLANWFLRRRNPGIQTYTYERAVHAARDRFTPRFAHRHAPEEVQQWFRVAGFQNVMLVDWEGMPKAQQDTYRRNVGVRGRHSKDPVLVSSPRN